MRRVCRSATHDGGAANVSVCLAVPHGGPTQSFDARCQTGGVGCLHELVSPRWLSPGRTTGHGRSVPDACLFHSSYECALDAPADRHHARASPGRSGRYGGRAGGWANRSGSSRDHAGRARRCDRRNGTVSRTRPTIRRAQCDACERASRIAVRYAGGRTMGHGRGGLSCHLCTFGRRTGPTVSCVFVLVASVRGNRYGRTCVDAVVGTMGGLMLSPHRYGARPPFYGLVPSDVRWRHG